MTASETSLDPISRAVLAFIRKERSQFAARVEIQADTEAGHSILEVRLPVPNPKIKYPLYITTENEELTWGFGGWHGHFPAATESDIAKVFSQIDSVLRDELLAVTFARDGKWAGGTLVEATEEIFTGLFEGFVGSVEVRSWSGSRDDDIQKA